MWEPFRRRAWVGLCDIASAAAAAPRVPASLAVPPGAAQLCLEPPLAAHRPHRVLYDAPVVLVHGYGGRADVWSPMVRGLHAAGFGTVLTFRYNWLRLTLDDAVSELAAALRETRETAQGWPLHLVGHSLGGLIVLAAAAGIESAERVRTVVTLGTPHRGTAIARLAAGRCAPDLRRGRTARLLGTAGPAPRWVNYYSEDDLVVPPASARLGHPAVTDVVLRGCGHLALVRRPTVIESVVNDLVTAELDAAPEVAAAV